MKKRLVAWEASMEDITIGKIYNIVDGDFYDNVGDIRSASHGDWENVQQGGDSVIKPGTIVDLTAVRDQAEYEEVCKAFMKAGADGDTGEWMDGNYPWQEWNYVGWDMSTGNLIHYDAPGSFSENGNISDVREIAVAEVLQSVIEPTIHPPLRLKAGVAVPTSQISSQAQYEAVCKALIRAGAGDGEFWSGDYPWHDWVYVGWSEVDHNLMHWDHLDDFSADKMIENIIVLHPDQVLMIAQEQEPQEPQDSGSVREKLESGYIVDFEGGESAMFVPKAFNGQDAFIKANGECHDVNCEFDEDLSHCSDSDLNVARIFDNMGGLGLGFHDNVAAEGHYGRGVVWTRPKKEFTFVNGVKVDKAKLEEFLKENEEDNGCDF